MEKQIERLSENEVVISFKKNGHELYFGVTKGCNKVKVGEIFSIGENSLADLLKYLTIEDIQFFFKASILQNINGNKTYGFPTPLGKRFPMERGDFLDLINFIEENG